jgi:hypothetical protein
VERDAEAEAQAGTGVDGVEVRGKGKAQLVTSEEVKRAQAKEPKISA